MPMFILYFDCADVVGFHIRMSPKVNAIAMICFIFLSKAMWPHRDYMPIIKKIHKIFLFFIMM